MTSANVQLGTSTDDRRMEIVTGELSDVIPSPLIDIITDYSRLSEIEKVEAVFAIIVKKRSSFGPIIVRANEDFDEWMMIHVWLSSNTVLNFNIEVGQVLDFGQNSGQGLHLDTYEPRYWEAKLEQLLPSKRLASIIPCEEFQGILDECGNEYKRQMSELMRYV
jgi:hypothetical protein